MGRQNEIIEDTMEHPELAFIPAKRTFFLTAVGGWRWIFLSGSERQSHGITGMGLANCFVVTMYIRAERMSADAVAQQCRHAISRHINS